MARPEQKIDLDHRLIELPRVATALTQMRREAQAGPKQVAILRNA